MLPLALTCGLFFGIAFGLTGIGSVFAVPLLVYAMGLQPHQAICVAMLSVSALSAVLSISNWRAGHLNHRAALLIGLGGVVGAPFGAWLSRFLSGPSLMLLFGTLTLLIAMRMLFAQKEPSLPGAEALAAQGFQLIGLMLAGLATGTIAGLLGMGALLLVPSLVLLARIEVHRAIATSTAAMLAIGIAAVVSHLLGGQTVPAGTTAFFVLGGLGGMLVGFTLARILSERHLRTVFALALLAISLLTLGRSFR